ncbi:MAG: queuosine precursor transporter [Candidatus Thorarchaeota archaeon]|jgi:uncharacterized integral membrane protein (TIGR00697 family)
MGVELVIMWILGTLAIATVAAVLAKNHGAEFLVGMFAASIVITAVIANKVVVFGPFILSASIIVFSVTFFLTDVLSEFWGKRMAQRAVWAGFLADVLLLFGVWVAIQWEPASFWTGQESFVQTLGVTGRVALASLLAYIIAQSHDVWAFHFWKERFNGRFLWLRK